MISAPHLHTLAEAERLPQGMLHWMIGVSDLYVYGGLLKRIIDKTSTVPLGDVDVIALDERIMQDMTERFGIAFLLLCPNLPDHRIPISRVVLCRSLRPKLKRDGAMGKTLRQEDTSSHRPPLQKPAGPQPVSCADFAE